jgi:hypothetical protein
MKSIFLSSKIQLFEYLMNDNNTTSKLESYQYYRLLVGSMVIDIKFIKESYDRFPTTRLKPLNTKIDPELN